MDTLTDYELARLADLRWRIQRGDYDLDRVPDTRVVRAAYWLTTHAPGLLAIGTLAGALILLSGLCWVASLPW